MYAILQHISIKYFSFSAIFFFKPSALRFSHPLPTIYYKFIFIFLVYFFASHFGSYENFLHEYAAYMPYGLSVAASFLPVLHVPHEFDMDRTASRSLDEIATEGYERGGANVDAELRALVVDMYNLYHELQLDLVE